ncbi:MAG: hypothetical protein GF347_05065 [Candidatus Moranbacteria bacterium]|nr:hypothetical protein [Candidatus Moranbacteria bacterium]
MMTKTTKFILALALQISVLVIVLVYKASISVGGTPVLLEIAPVDPRDPLRGDYVTFRYERISHFGGYMIKDDSIKQGDTVYVTLIKSNPYWKPVQLEKKKPNPKTLNNEKVFLKGKVIRSYIDKEGRGKDSSVDVRYGIEEYFIPEGTGQNINFLNKETAAMVAIDQDGNAVLKRLYVDNKPWP